MAFSADLMTSCIVRVLLDEGNLQPGLTWQFSTPKKKFICSFENGNLSCNSNKSTCHGLVIRSHDERCTYKDGVYAGDVALIIQGERWYVINTVPLEEYVFCVLRCESWPGWPLEVNKAFAIMVRTYVVHKLISLKKSKKQRLFDIKSTNIHQTYKGLHACEQLKTAVEETEGIIIAYNKQPIVAMYDSCCGGIVPSKLTGFDFKENPYLARAYPCTYCAESKLYAWKVVYSQQSLLELLQHEFPQLKQCKDMRVSSVDAAGKVLEVTVKHGRGYTKISGATIYNICKDVRSFCYTIHKQGSLLVFEGKGFGHHVGLCQWGVRAMERQGFTYKQMLAFYYPGTLLMKLVIVY